MCFQVRYKIKNKYTHFKQKKQNILFKYINMQGAVAHINMLLHGQTNVQTLQQIHSRIIFLSVNQFSKCQSHLIWKTTSV